jgi:ribonucleoside-diphosphate reductase alpha chain
MLAWRSGLKGLATYRPNAILGSVLSVPSTEQKAEVLADVKKDEDPLKKQFERRPMGDLDAVIRKVEYSSSEGKKTVYLAISYQTVEGVHEGEPVVIERPVEFFMPAGQRTEGQQWIASTMRLLSMAARLGGSIAKALDDLREVVWDKGPVRCGFIEKDDGTQVPRYHESEVAAIGYSLQRILIKRNFLDADGNQVPVKALAQSYSNRHRMPEEIIVEPVKQAPVNGNKLIAGKRCKSCGAHNVIRKDGCDFCTNCSEIGSCG